MPRFTWWAGTPGRTAVRVGGRCVSPRRRNALNLSFGRRGDGRRGLLRLRAGRQGILVADLPAEPCEGIGLGLPRRIEPGPHGGHRARGKALVEHHRPTRSTRPASQSTPSAACRPTRTKITWEGRRTRARAKVHPRTTDPHPLTVRPERPTPLRVRFSSGSSAGQLGLRTCVTSPVRREALVDRVEVRDLDRGSVAAGLRS